MTKRLNVVGTEFIFETIEMLTLEIKFIQHKKIAMFEFGLLNNKEKRRLFNYETSVY